MKNRIAAVGLALVLSLSFLAGCGSQAEKNQSSGNDTNSELLQAITELKSEISMLRGQLALDPGTLFEKEENISDKDGEEINRLVAENEKNYLANPPTGLTQVKSRDWSKYTSESAKSKLSKNEAELYSRFDAVCRDYLTDPSHGVVKWNNSLSTKGLNYSDLGFDTERALNVLWWFKYNNPQYYFLRGAKTSENQLFLTIYDFVTEMGDPAAVTNEMFDKLDGWIAECCDDEVTTWEKVLAANKKICEAVIYDPKVKAKVKGAAGGKNQSLYSVLMSPETVCAGYSLTYCAMTNAMGIDTLVVLSDTHAWNATKFDSVNYYFVDVCWNDEDNGYNEDHIGFGSDYATYIDNGTSSHIYEAANASWAPSIPKVNYQAPSSSSSSLDAPNLRVSGSGASAVKVEWDAVANAEKYEYAVFFGSKLIQSAAIEDTFVYLFVPSGESSVKVSVRAQGTENGKKLYSAQAEITAAVDNSSNKPSVPTDIKSSTNDNGGLKLSWTNPTGKSVLFFFDSDNTFTSSPLSWGISTGITWTKWNPEKETYFAVAAASNNGGKESISDLVKFSYSKNGGVKLITGNAANNASSVEAPENFRAHMWLTNKGERMIQCNWGAVSGADGYEVQLSYKSDFSEIASSTFREPEKNAFSYMIGTSTADHYYRIRTKKGDDYSEWVTTKYVFAENIPASASVKAPENFRAFSWTNDAGKLVLQCNWDQVADADGYVVQFSPNPDFSVIYSSDIYGADTKAKTNWPIDGVNDYYFRVRTIKGDNYSEWATVKLTIE